MDNYKKVELLIDSININEILGTIYTIDINNIVLYKKDLKTGELKRNIKWRIKVNLLKRHRSFGEPTRIETEKLDSFELAFKYLKCLLSLELKKKDLLNSILENPDIEDYTEETLKELEKNLARAIEIEDYVKASIIRDKINILKI